MRPLLKRWLQICHLLTDLETRPWVCKDDKEHLEPAVIPTTYVFEELTTEFANYWTKIQDDKEKLEKIQLHVLSRRQAFRFASLGKNTESHPLLLDIFLEIFDNSFFLGALRPYIEIDYADDTPANSAWVGNTERKRKYGSSAPPEIQIQIERPPKQLWTRRLMQRSLDTLLYEMAHAFFFIYTAPMGVLGFCCYRRLVQTEGLTGHGPFWVKVATTIAAEADWSLGGLWGKWSLGISKGLLCERAAPRDLHDRKGLEMMGKEFE